MASLVETFTSQPTLDVLNSMTADPARLERGRQVAHIICEEERLSGLVNTEPDLLLVEYLIKDRGLWHEGDTLPDLQQLARRALSQTDSNLYALSPGAAGLERYDTAA